ncbi:MAG: class I SAM-dependent methyltransferase [Neisseria sp.]|nr:class I SAM-dependent methyltransferase [Neisseria sp.]
MKPANLPPPPPEALASSAKLEQIIYQEIQESDNWLPFSQFMEMVLYTPQYGYYTGGAWKIGAAGDFVTAPAISPLFAHTLGRQLGELLPGTAGNIYEFGAGGGELAADLLDSLAGGLNTYYIIELSAGLAERQKQFITRANPQAAAKVRWLDRLPARFDGIIIGNEVLDAIPCELVSRSGGGFQRMGVAVENGRFAQTPRPLEQPELIRLAAAYFPDTSPYTSELHPRQYAFARTLAQRLERGALILIDYGFDAAQYYHPQRHMGTLIGHYRHHTVHDPFFHIGLTDLTSHVNFTDIAQAATDAGLDLIGYTAQADFLLNLGITELLEQTAPCGTPAYLKAASDVNKLIAPHEMGELFKVIAFGRDIGIDWRGFTHGDICHKL